MLQTWDKQNTWKENLRITKNLTVTQLILCSSPSPTPSCPHACYTHILWFGCDEAVCRTRRPIWQVFQSAHFFNLVATIGCRKYVQRDIKISVLSKTGTASQPCVTLKEKFFHSAKYWAGFFPFVQGHHSAWMQNWLMHAHGNFCGAACYTLAVLRC